MRYCETCGEPIPAHTAAGPRRQDGRDCPVTPIAVNRSRPTRLVTAAKEA